jgi:uncharacterized protein
MPKTLTIFLLLGAGAYAACCLVLFLLQRSLIYFPPAAAACRAPATSTLAVPGAKVKVSERPHAGDKAVIYFGGNAEDVTASLPLLDRAYPGRALYLLHYRGYAGSTGTPSEQALVGDALALLDRVAQAHPDIVVVGRSLGAAVALQVASQRQVSRLVLVTPFDSLQALAAAQFPYLPVRWLLRDRYDSSRHALRVTAPTLIVAAGADEIIPARSTATLLSRFPQDVASMRVLEGAGHNSISGHPEFVASLQWSR